MDGNEEVAPRQVRQGETGLTCGVVCGDLGIAAKFPVRGSKAVVIFITDLKNHGFRLEMPNQTDNHAGNPTTRLATSWGRLTVVMEGVAEG